VDDLEALVEDLASAPLEDVGPALEIGALVVAVEEWTAAGRPGISGGLSVGAGEAARDIHRTRAGSRQYPGARLAARRPGDDGGQKQDDDSGRGKGHSAGGPGQWWAGGVALRAAAGPSRAV